MSSNKSTLGESEGQMPTHNSRKNLNEMAGEGNSQPSKDTERGFTDGEKFGEAGKDNMKIRGGGSRSGY